MKAIPRQAVLKRILTGSFIFYVFSGISSLLNYVFYPVIARLVPTTEYGEIQFLVSMFTQLAVGFVVLNILAIIISAKITKRQEQSLAIKNLNAVATIVILSIVIIGLGVIYFNKSILGFTSDIAIIALAFSLLINVPFTISIGQLQGNGRFIASGIVSMLAALLKLVFSVLFVIMGFGVAGAILGIGTGMIFSLIITLLLNKKKAALDSGEYKPSFIRSIDFRQLIFIRKQAIVAILAVTAITLLSSADSIVSRIILNPEVAGRYAAVATIAKIILATTAPIMWLALPPAVKRDRTVAIKYVLIASIVAFTIGLLFIIFPSFFVNQLLGINAGSYIKFVPIASIAMALCSVGFILVCVSICLSHLWHVIISTTAAVILYFATLFILSAIAGPLGSSIYGQMIAASCFIIGGSLALRSRYFE